MNPEAQERLDEILKLNPDALNPEQVAFLKARRSYLKKSQLEEYKEVLEAENAPEEVEDEDDKTPYQDLLTRAKELGYTGSRISRAKLEDFISNAEEENKKQNPFE